MSTFLTEHFFVGNSLVASAAYRAPTGEPDSWLGNVAYFCLVCGEVWGRRVFSNPPLPLWRVSPRACVAHGGGYFIGRFDAARELNALAKCGDQPEFLQSELLAWSNKHEYGKYL